MRQRRETWISFELLILVAAQPIVRCSSQTACCLRAKARQTPAHPRCKIVASFRKGTLLRNGTLEKREPDYGRTRSRCHRGSGDGTDNLKPPPLTLECASVIVIASTDQPSRPRDDAHALPQSSTSGPNRALRHLGTVPIPITPRSESSGSVQPILSTMLSHDG